MMRPLIAELRGASRRLTEGFTLVELMVAVTGGLFVSVAVFMLAKQATGLYQSEARVSNATLGSVVGFERLRLDLERTSFLSSPNVRRDPKVCGVPNANWPTYLAHLSSIFIDKTATVPAVLTANGVAPDEITLAGSFSSVEQFWTSSISNSGTNHVVTLQTLSPAMARLGYQNAATAAAQQTLLQSVFGTGRALRIVDTEGNEQYGTIQAVQSGSAPSILLGSTTPDILYRGTNTTLKCGVMGNGKDHLVNVVNLVRYSLKNLSSNGAYAPLYDTTVTANNQTVATGAVATDTGRTELVREELDTAGAIIQGTDEIVTEFAVDLRFGLTVSQMVVPSGGGAASEQLQELAMGSAAVYAFAGPPDGTQSAQAPQFIRAVRVRLSVRSREADRLSGMPSLADGGTVPIPGGLYRIGLGSGGGGPFARVRTMQADIALRNHRGISWL
jgi:hypothetical protein